MKGGPYELVQVKEGIYVLLKDNHYWGVCQMVK